MVAAPKRVSKAARHARRSRRESLGHGIDRRGDIVDHKACHSVGHDLWEPNRGGMR